MKRGAVSTEIPETFYRYVVVHRMIVRHRVEAKVRQNLFCWVLETPDHILAGM